MPGGESQTPGDQTPGGEDQIPAEDDKTSTDEKETPEASYRVVLEWRAPVAREDGSALSMNELAGYVIHYGRQEGKYNKTVKISDPYQQSYTLSELTPGSYHFVLVAQDVMGRLSEYSNALEVAVP